MATIMNIPISGVAPVMRYTTFLKPLRNSCAPGTVYGIRKCAAIRRSASSLPLHTRDSESRPYMDSSLPDLINSYLVFKMCGFDKLVDNASILLEKLDGLGLGFLSNKIIKGTFFRHFCGGENAEELRKTSERLSAMNIGSILDYACEADYDESGTLDKDKAIQSSKKFVDLIVNTVGWCDPKSKPEPFIVAKVTSIISPHVLIAWTNTYELFRKEFDALSKDGKVKFDDFVKLSAKFPAINAESPLCKKAFEQADRDKDGSIQFYDLIPVISIMNYEFQKLLLGVDPKTPVKYAGKFLEQIHLDIIEASVPYSEKLIRTVMDRGLLLCIDAEQTYFHPAIDDYSISLARKYHYDDRAAVYNTYQFYLKNTRAKLEEHFKSFESLKIPIGVKAVRGAYVKSETFLAKEHNYESPVNPSYEITNECYDSALEFCIKKIANSAKGIPTSLLICTHNVKSVDLAMKSLEKYGIESRKHVAFAQLYGMKDSLTSEISKSPFSAYKYLPYGPVEIAVPYLLRRAVENRSILKAKYTPQGQREATDGDLVYKEIVRRLSPRGRHASTS